MRALAIASLLLATLAPSVAAECAVHACVDGWSEDDGSCTAGGSERNVVEANASVPEHPNVPAIRLGDTRIRVETLCLKEDRGEYREVRVGYRTDPRVDDRETLILWSWDGEECKLDRQTTRPRQQPVVEHMGCPQGTPPPRTPPLLP